MEAFRREFIELCLARQVLRFGEFTLKSGRISPYFFDAGLFNTGAALAALGRCYARAIVAAGLQFDVLFGPAYKGIALAASTAMALAGEHGRDVGYCFNRKEVKDHGEGGAVVGAPLRGRVLLIDDVITAGTAIGEALEIIAAHGAELTGVIIALDRQERGSDASSAVQSVAARCRVPVVSIAALSDVLEFLAADPAQAATVAAIEAYRSRYGVMAASDRG